MFACVSVHGVPADGPPVAADALSSFAREYSPRVEAARGACVVFDASGLERLFGGPRQLAAHVAGAARARGWTCGVAIAHTRTAALLLAHAGPGETVVPCGREAQALAGLPLALLMHADAETGGAPENATDRGPSEVAARPGSGPPAAAGPARTTAAGSARHYRLAPLPRPPAAPAALPLIDTLHRWGLVTIGDLAVLPRAGVHARLGEPGVRWHRLAHGDDLRPLVRETTGEPYTHALALEWPIEGLEPLSFVLARVLEPLCARLERDERGAVGLRLWLRLVSRAVHTSYLQVPSPIRDAKTLRTLLLLHLETRSPDAGIDEVTLTLDVAPGRLLQRSLLARPLPAPDQVSTLVARLGALMGEGRCGQPALVDSARPGTFALLPFAPTAVPAETPAAGGARRGSVRADQGGSPRTADEGQRHARQGEPAAVLRRYRRPLPARVVTAGDGRPTRVTPRLATLPGGGGRSGGPVGGVVQEAAGPWRTAGEWWREAPAPGRRGGPWDREEWDVAAADGGVYRLSRDVASNEWVVEGYWD